MTLTKYQIIKDIFIFSFIAFILYSIFSPHGMFSKRTGNDGDTTIVYNHTTIIKDSSIHQGIETPKPITYTIHHVSKDSLIAILKEFQIKNKNVVIDTSCKKFVAYNDTLQNDSNAFVAVYDTTQGQLLSRRKFIKIYSRTIDHEKIIEVKRKEWHILVGAYVGQNNFTPNLIYSSKKRYAVGGGWNLITNQPSFFFGYQLK